MTTGRIMTAAETRTVDSPFEIHEFLPGIKVVITTRGTNDGSPYSGFNVCHYTGDDEARIAACRGRLCEMLGITPERLIVPRQTHSVNVVEIKSLPVAESSIEGVDGVVTDLDNVAIGVSTADCVPVLLADDVAGIVGAAHAGWRGAVGGIVTKTVDAMVSLGADREKIHAFIGPCIGPECFEVGEEVAARFPANCVIRQCGSEKPHVDLRKYIVAELGRCGVPSGAVTLHPCCTKCNPSRYFSARAIGINSGRNFSLIIMDRASRRNP